MKTRKKLISILLTLVFTMSFVICTMAATNRPVVTYDTPLYKATVKTWNIGKPTDTDVTATLDDTGVLTITGTGDIDPAKCLWSGISGVETTGTTNMVDVKSVVFTGAVKPTSMESLFSGNTNLTAIDWGTIDLTECTSFKDAFSNTGFTTIDLSTLDADKVKDWSGAFQNCSKLTTANISNCITSEATDISFLFENCNQLTSVNLTGSNTSNVKDMTAAFASTALTSLDVSSFNTSKVEDTKMTNFIDLVPTLTSLVTGANFKVPEGAYYDYAENGYLFRVNSTAPLDITGEISDSLKTYVLLCQKNDKRNVTYNGTAAKSLWHIVTFDAAGGTLTGPEYYAVGHKGKAVRPSDPTRTNYTFQGWYNGDTLYNFTLPVTTDLTLTAGWKENTTPTPDPDPDPGDLTDKYTVTFVAGTSDGEGSNFSGGKYTTTAKTKADGTVTLPGNPLDQYGITFSYWSTQKVDSWRDTGDDGSHKFTTSTKVSNNLTVYAVYTETNNEGSFYKVEFNYNGGKLKGKSSKTEYVRKGSKVSKPSSDPKRDGYSFKGWYTGDTKDDDKFDFDEKITEDTTIFAQWKDKNSSSSSSSSRSSSSSSWLTGDATTDSLLSALMLDSLFGGATKSGYTFRNGQWYDANGNAVSMNSVSGMPNTGLGFQGIPIIIVLGTIILGIVFVIRRKRVSKLK